MRRMLSLPRVANTLIAMLRAGVLGLPEHSVKLLHSYERRARRPDLTARFAILLAEVPAEVLQDIWRLSNEDIRTALAVLNVARLLGDFRVNEAAYRYPAALADGVEVTAAS
jgi:poly(A) polymerase